MKNWAKTLLKDSLTLLEDLIRVKRDSQTPKKLIGQIRYPRGHKDFCIKMRKDTKIRKRENN